MGKTFRNGERDIHRKKRKKGKRGLVPQKREKISMKDILDNVEEYVEPTEEEFYPETGLEENPEESWRKFSDG